MFVSFAKKDRIVERLLAAVTPLEALHVSGDTGDNDANSGAQHTIGRVLRRKGTLSALMVVSLLMTFVRGIVAGLACLILGMLVLLLNERRFRKQRMRNVERDLPALLTSVASSVRAGIDPLVALSEAREFIPTDSPIAAELERYHRSLAAGGNEDEILDQLFQAVTTPDIELFKGCLRLSRKLGSSLAEPLHRVTRVVRQRQSFRRKTRAALAMHRMSAIGISACAALIALMQAVMNPDGIRLVMAHSVGSALLISGGLLIAVGVVWMMSLGRETSV